MKAKKKPAAVVQPQKPTKLEGNRAKLLQIAKVAAHFSNGRLRVAYNEADGSRAFDGEASHFLKIDGTRLGRDIEMYGFMGDGPVGWEMALAMFLEEVLLQIKKGLPKSYVEAGRMLCKLGESVYSANLLEEWRSFF